LSQKEQKIRNSTVTKTIFTLRKPIGNDSIFGSLQFQDVMVFEQPIVFFQKQQSENTDEISSFLGENF
jgi:hypothetical protein